MSSFIKDINGKLHNIVVGYFPQENNVKDLDIISMEANIDTDMFNNVNDILDISGIAMDSSLTNSPAFPGAKLMSAIQCFESDEDKNKKNLEKEKPMTFEEAKQFIKDHNVHPSQLYTEKQIQADREFVHVFDENAKLKSQNELLIKTNEELKVSSEEMEKSVNLTKASKTLDGLLKEGYTDKQKEFIKKRFTPDSLDATDEKSVEKFLDNAKKEYADFAKLFGGSEDETAGEGAGKSTKTTEDGSKDPVEQAMAELEK